MRDVRVAADKRILVSIPSLVSPKTGAKQGSQATEYLSLSSAEVSKLNPALQTSA